MSVILKELAKSGVLRGIVGYIRAKTPLWKRYANVADFSVQKWTRRFKSLQTSHAERLGMLRGIPEDLSVNEWVLILRNVVIDWVDGFADFLHFKPEVDQMHLVRKEAVLVLSGVLRRINESEHLIDEYVKVKGFYEDMVTFFKPDASLDRTVENLSNPFADLENRGQPMHSEGEGIKDAMQKFVQILFATAWKQKLDEESFGPDEFRAKEQSRKWTIFLDLVHIDPTQIGCLHMTEQDFKMIADFVCLSAGANSLEGIIWQEKSAPQGELDWYVVGQELRVLAIRRSWL